MLQKIVKVIGGDPHRREIEKMGPILDEINRLEEPHEKLSDEELLHKTDEFRQRLSSGENLDELLPEAFAVVREASKRTIGLRHYDVQMIGGYTLHRGQIAEMRTGEGKTLVATLPLYLNALEGKGAHLVTVNDYLARRDARWMAPIYNALGLSVGVLQMAARTENGHKAFLVDSTKTSPIEDQNQLRLVLRGEAYKADITYGTNSEFGFDYLRDNLTMSLEERCQRGHHYAIVDEVDNILIDEARTPLIISGPAQDDTEWYIKMSQVARALNPDDYEVNEKDHAVSLTEIGEAHVEDLLNIPLRDPERPEDITPEQARLLGYLEQSLRAQFLYRRNKDYLVQGGKVIIVDEFTGRLMPGRRWSDGLHQSVEAKEGVKVEAENVTYATITLQNYFRMYDKLAGMTGTALTEAEEFHKIYKLEVLPIPMNLEFRAAQVNSPLEEVDARDGQGYRYSYYTERGSAEKKPVFFRRKDYPDVVYRSTEFKLRAITHEIVEFWIKGRPNLVGTTSVEHSELLSERLQAEPVRRLMQTLLIRQAWLEKNNRQDDERAIPELKALNAPINELQAGDIRQLARSVDISMNPEDTDNLNRLVTILDLEERDKPRLIAVLQGGVPHQVLNARKHDEESQIIARAGAFGSVTIATNMAGRGVDIKLGGELPEEILADVNRVLAKTGRDPYAMTNEQRRQALIQVKPEDYGIYEEPVQAFFKYFEDMERVHALGGLHVIGSERHEARRIDNQLRGRSARQGDPGSSRFYLALDDELMRLFGGQQVEGLLGRLNIDENLPIESNMVGRLVEQSQERVEGANFDIRKHLLEYDDVLNSQRKRIYSQRDRVFVKEDLSEDVLEMLHSELEQRVPQNLKDEEGPWKLLAFLEEIQPALIYEDISYPSFTTRLLLDQVKKELKSSATTLESLRKAMLSLAEQALHSEREHAMRGMQSMLEAAEESLETQRLERFDTLDAFMDGLDTSEENGPAPRPQQALEELSNYVRVPLKLPPDLLRQLPEKTRIVNENLRGQIATQLLVLTVNRVMGNLKRRLPEAEDVKITLRADESWSETAEQILQVVTRVFDQREARLLGENGQIGRDLDPLLAKLGGTTIDDRQLILLLQNMAQGARMVFDRKTHRQTWQMSSRLVYVYLAAHLIDQSAPDQITLQVVDHLEKAVEVLQMALGRSEWNRMLQTEAKLEYLEPRLKQQVREAFGEEHFSLIAEKNLLEISTEDRDLVSGFIGLRMQSEIYRSILLSAISDLWVDYLTKVEALRVSIGLEAYAQRDPLVMYKGRASEMFSQLLADIRLAVISRMFSYQPRQAQAPSSQEPSPQETPQRAAPAAPTQQEEGGRKKKRHRH